jgi:hypothetical protein
MKKLHAKLTFRKPDQSGSTEANNENDETGSDYDEEEVRQELEARLEFSSSSNRVRENKSDDNLVWLDMNHTESCFEISDFPDAMEPGYNIFFNLNNCF